MNHEENQNPEPIATQERFIEPEIQKMGFFNRLISIFVSPRELMCNIKEYPVFFTMILVSILIALAVIPLTVEYTNLSLREMYNISMERFGEDRFGYGAMMTGFVNEYGEELIPMTLLMTVASAFNAVIMPFFMIFVSALVLFIISKICRGSTGLGRMFSMMAHIYVITSVGMALVILLAVMNNSPMDFTSLQPLLLPQGNMAQPLYWVLSFVSLFRIWEAVLIFIGVKVINDFSNVKAGVITGVYMMLYAAAVVVPMAFTWSL